MTEFHLFPQLPLELRWLIWKECLPKERVFGIIWPCDYAGPSPNRCQKPFWSRVANKIPPVITGVCRESRAVALEVGRFVHEIGGYKLPTPAWAIPKAGITVDYCFLTSSWLLGKGGGEDPIVRAIIVDQDANGRYSDFGRWAKLYREKPPDAYLPRTIFICRWIIFLHISLEEMVDSQLFGRLGEEVIQLVDPMDFEKLNRFKTLAVNSGPQLPYTRDFFKLMDTDTTHFKEQLAEDLEQTRQCFFWHMWLAAHANGFQGVLDPEDIWIGPRSRKDGSRLDMLAPGTYYDDLSDQEEPEEYVPNVKHPWVQEVLGMMPDFSLRVMFRPCPYQCWVPSTPITPYTPGSPSGDVDSTPLLITGPLTRYVSPTDFI